MSCKIPKNSRSYLLAAISPIIGYFVHENGPLNDIMFGFIIGASLMLFVALFEIDYLIWLKKRRKENAQ
jgi:hypothetical protein